MKGLITSNWQYFFLQQQLTVKSHRVGGDTLTTAIPRIDVIVKRMGFSRFQTFKELSHGDSTLNEENTVLIQS